MGTLTEAVLTCTHDLCFEQKYEKSQTNSNEKCHFYTREKSLYVAWACFSNVISMCSCNTRCMLRNRFVYFWIRIICNKNLFYMYVDNDCEINVTDLFELFLVCIITPSQ